MFIYFISGEKAKSDITKEKLIESGLGYAMDENDELTTRQVSGGPNGKDGYLIGIGEVKKLGYSKKTQTWREIDEDVYIGYYNSNKPTASRLMRKKYIPGKEVELGDGNGWIIPVGKHWDYNEEENQIMEISTIPRFLDYDPKKKEWVYGAASSSYTKVWDLTVKAWEYLCLLAEKKNIPVADLLNLSTDILSLNYKVSPIEVGMLQLLDESMMTAIAVVIVDYDGVAELLDKKKLLAQEE